jgi:predicted acyl esterase
MDKTNSTSDGTSKLAFMPPNPREIVRKWLLGVKVQENIYVEMRDGVKLAVDIYSPESGGRYPALLSMAPYIKEIQQHPPQFSHSIEAGATGFFVPKGYVHVIAQTRGSGLSQGQWNFLDTKEQQDGYDLVEWMAQQPWCDGNVGMIGDSYWGWIQYLVAAQRPPHLRCIAPHDSGTDMYRDTFYQGGIFTYGEFGSAWTVDTIFQCVWPGPVKGKLPPVNLAVDLASHPHDGSYYWERSAWTKLDKIEVPMLSVVAQSVSRHCRGQLDVYPRIKAKKRLLVEPQTGFWSHLHFLMNRPLNEQMLRWYDYWLKGIDTGIMDEPEVAIFDSATREWRYENEYPLKRTEWTKFYLRSNPSGRATDPPYGLISMDSPGSEAPDKYRIPESTSVLLAGKPVLAYATSALKDDVRVWGPLSATLYGSSTSVDTAWFVKLMDIGFDNKVNLVSQGILRASYREVDGAKSRPGQPLHPFRKRDPLEPNTVYEFQIEMLPAFHTFKAGHKIWLQIASDDLTYFGRLHTLDVPELPLPAENAIYHDSEYPSHLLLPVIPDAPIIKPVETPVSQITWSLTPGIWWPDLSGWPLIAGI